MIASKKQRTEKTIFDPIIYVAAIAAPIMTLPQLYKVWSDKQASGVSIQTWVTYAIISFVWVLYGFRIKAKPVILTNGLLLVTDTLIVIGVALYR